MKKENKKVLLATGIFPPDVGGPATYISNLSRELKKLGADVGVVTFCDEESGVRNQELGIRRVSRKQNIFFRYVKYFSAAYRQVKDSDVVIAFDLSSSGIPAVIAAKLRRKKILVRLGGDFLWEKAFARSWTDLPLDEFYEQKKNFKLKLYFFVNKFILRFFDKVVFTSQWQKNIYLKHYRLTESKIKVIKNSFFQNNNLEQIFRNNRNKKMIFAGRLIKLKNLDRIIEAVSEFENIMFDIYGEGPEKNNLKKMVQEMKLEGRVRILPKLSHDEFMKKLEDSYVAIVPSVSEISPVTMMECIKLGKPVLVTKKCGYYEDFKNELMFFDPMNMADIKAKIEMVYCENIYNQYLEKIRKIDTSRDYSKVGGEWLEIV